MRELAELDLQSTFWEEDIRTFEGIRLREITGQANTSIREKDRESLKNLLSEVTETPWRIDIPTNLPQGIQTTLAQIEYQGIVIQVEGRMKELDTAYAAMDLAAAGTIVDEIEVLTGRAPYALPASLEERLAPARDWVATQREQAILVAQFEAACAELAGGMNSNLPTNQLILLKNAAAAFGFKIPDELSGWLMGIINKRERAIRARKTRKILLIAGAAILVVVATGLYIRVRLIETAESTVCDRFSDLVLADQLEEAERFWGRVVAGQPSLLKRPKMQSTKALLDIQIGREKTRQEEFAAHMKNAMKAGPENPNLKELDLAQEKAKTSADKLAVLDFKEQIETSKKDRLGKLAEEVRKKLTEMKTAVDRLAASDAARNGTADTSLLSTVETDLLALSRKPDLDSELKSSIDKEYSRIPTIRRELLAIAKERQDYEYLFKDISSAKVYREAVESFVVKYPKSARSEPLKKVLLEASSWESAEQWFALAQSFNGPLTPAVATVGERIKAADPARSGHRRADVPQDVIEPTFSAIISPSFRGHDHEVLSNLCSVCLQHLPLPRRRPAA